MGDKRRQVWESGNRERKEAYRISYDYEEKRHTINMGKRVVVIVLTSVVGMAWIVCLVRDWENLLLETEKIIIINNLGHLRDLFSYCRLRWKKKHFQRYRRRISLIRKMSHNNKLHFSLFPCNSNTRLIKLTLSLSGHCHWENRGILKSFEVRTLITKVGSNSSSCKFS